MRTIDIDVYEFDELSEDVQEKVINHYRDLLGNVLNDKLECDMINEFNNYIDTLNLTLRYSLNYCQGDGVSFTGTVEGKEELLKLANLVYEDNIPRKILRLINWDIIYKVDFDETNPHYVHKYTVMPTVVDNYNMNDDYYHIRESMDEFDVDIKKWYSIICDTFEDFGYNRIDSLNSEDNIKSYIINNDLEFFADGRDYNE